MATNKPCIEIPNRFKSLNNSDDPAIAHIVAGADDVYDDSQGRKQNMVNADVARHEAEINDPTNGLQKRVDDIEAMSQIGDTPVETDAGNIISNTSLSGKVPSASAVNGVYNALDAQTGYYTCDTAGGEAAKTVAAPGFVLSNGGSVKIKMTNANSVSNATLNINSTGAKALYYDGERAGSSNTWEDGETIEVYYDGTSYYANNVAGGSSDGVFDLTAKTGDTYATLSDALTAANTAIPANKKKGGMSMKYVHTSDNMYVQYRYMLTYENTTAGNAAFLNPDNWQGVDEEPTAASNNLITSNAVFAVAKEVIAQSPVTSSTINTLLPVNIQQGDTFKVIVNVSGTFTRLIINYNDTASKRLIDSADAGDFSNTELVFVARENITILGLYITGTCKASISLLKPYNIDDRVNDMDTRLNNLLYGDNILFNKNTLCFYNKYYKEAAVNSNSYTYFAFPVESGKTYHIYPKVRFISKDGVNIQGESTKDVFYTADFTGNLYVTFFNDSPNWIVTEKESFTGIAGYDTIAKAIFENKRGISNLYSVSQLGLRDVVAEYVYGSKNLVSTALCKDGYYYNSGPSANNNYLYFKVALEANVDYYVSPGIRYISKDGQNIAAYPDLTNSFIVFTPDTSTDYYFTYNKGEDITGYFIGKKQGFISPNSLFAKKWVSCGDSFTKGDFSGATGSTTFADMPYVGQKMTYPLFIGRRCGMNVVNEAISGSTMAYVDGNRHEFSTVNGRYTQLPADADYITLWFGINDSHRSVPIGNIDDNVNTTFYGAWNIVMDYLISNHPNAKIGIIISNGCDTTAYPAATRDIAKKWGVSYLDLNGDYKVPLMLRTNEKTEVAASVLQSILEKQSVNYPDNQHPSVAAHEYESYFIESWLKSL